MESEGMIIVDMSLEGIQKRTIVHCKQEMAMSILLGAFAGLLGLGGLIYAGTIPEPEDGLKLLANVLGVGFLGIALLFFLRSLIRLWLLGVIRKRHVIKLWIGVGVIVTLDTFIVLLSLAVILWTDVLKWLILLIFSITLGVWRLKTLIQYAIECNKSASTVSSMTTV